MQRRKQGEKNERDSKKGRSRKDYYSRKFSHSDHTSQVGKAWRSKRNAQWRPRGRLEMVARSSLDALPKEAAAPAEKLSRKAEIQVKMRRSRSAPHALYNSLKILIRLRNELESKANSQLSYGSWGNLLCHSNTLAIYSPRLCRNVTPLTWLKRIIIDLLLFIHEMCLHLIKQFIQVKSIKIWNMLKCGSLEAEGTAVVKMLIRINRHLKHSNLWIIQVTFTGAGDPQEPPLI